MLIRSIVTLLKSDRIKIRLIQDSDPEDPLLDPYKTLRSPGIVNNLLKFVVQGEKSILRLLKSTCKVESILATHDFYKKVEPYCAGRQESIHVYLGESDDVRAVIGYQMYQEVMAVASIPSPPSLHEVMQTQDRPWLFVATEGISNAENMGTLIRNCSGFGVDGLITSQTCCSPYLRRSVRCTMGTIFNIPIILSENLAENLKILKSHGVSIFGTLPHADQLRLSQANFERDSCIVFGSEGSGLSDSIAELCDYSINIPMHLETDSLNVASASSVFLYEANRQREKA